MAVRVVEPGRLNRIRCPECEALLEFEESDVYTVLEDEYRFEYLDCPECDAEICIGEELLDVKEIVDC